MHSRFSPTATLFLLVSLAFATNATSQTLETVTVTASRQATELKDLAGNTSVLSSEELRQIAHTHINEAIARVPGSWISRGNGQEHLTAIRSPVFTGAGACGAFLMAEDGIALRAAGFCNVNQLFEVNSEQARQIEVVRGPGSSLYGSNAMHGTINVLSFAAPEQNQTLLGLDAGPDDYYRLKAHQALVSGAHSLRIYGNFGSDGGYKQDSGFDQQKVNVSHYYQAEGLQVKNHLSLTNLNQETAGFIEGADAYKDEALKRLNENPEAFRDAESARLYSQIDWQLESGATLRIKPYLRYSRMTFLQHFVPWQPTEETGVDSFGLQSRYSVTNGALDLALGVDLEYTDGFLKEIQAEGFSPNIPAGVHYDYDVTNTSFSPFTSLSWAASERLQLNASLRFDYSEYDYTNNTGSNSACAATASNCRFARPDSRKDSFNNWSPSVSALFRMSDDAMAYMKLSRGFRAPQATELYRLQAGQLISDLDPVRLDSLELGIRGEMGSFSYDLAAYRMDKKDVIFQDSDRQNISGGETSHTGLELDLHARLSEHWSVAVNGTVARHKYENSISIRGVNSTTDINGKDVDTAPRYSSNARLLWQPSESWRSELEWLRLGSYYQNPENTAKYSGHDLVNLRTSYDFAGGWQLGLRLVNALDTEYAERADFAFGDDRYFVGTPRALYASVKVQF